MRNKNRFRKKIKSNHKTKPEEYAAMEFWPILGSLTSNTLLCRPHVHCLGTNHVSWDCITLTARPLPSKTVNPVVGAPLFSLYSSKKERDCAVIALVTKPGHYLYLRSRPSTEVGMYGQLRWEAAAGRLRQLAVTLTLLSTLYEPCSHNK